MRKRKDGPDTCKSNGPEVGMIQRDMLRIQRLLKNDKKNEGERRRGTIQVTDQ